MSDLEVRQTETELLFTQILDAPKELVFESFSSAEHLKQWWGPPGCSVDTCEVDFTVGGEWKYSILTQTGVAHWAKAIYSEIIPFEKIVFDDYFLDAQHSIIEQLPSKHVEVFFTSIGELTELVVHIQLKTASDRDQLLEMGFLQGFSQALNQLTSHIQTIH